MVLGERIRLGELYAEQIKKIGDGTVPMIPFLNNCFY